MSASELVHDLPDGMTAWIAEVGGGTLTRLERHVARREAWVVDVTRPDGSVLEGFLRLQRDDAGDPRRLERETRIVQAVAAKGIPAPEVHGWNPDLRCALFTRDPGRSDLDALEDPVRQRAVMEHFMRVVAQLHTLDPDSLGLDEVMGERPKSARACAMAEVERIAGQWKAYLDDAQDPLTTYALAWLDRFAPDEVARVALVQGDTGPVNFMFQGDQVSAVIDWETGHWGDPLEDLGNIAVREFWNPSGGLTGLFDLYAKESGIAYDRFRAQYYAVHQNVRGMIPIHYVSEHAHPRESLAWYLCYRYVGDRATSEMLAQAMGVEVEAPSLPDETAANDVLAAAATYAQERDVLPGLEDPFAASRARDVITLIACMDRRRRYGPALQDADREEWSQLLGRDFATHDEARLALTGAIRDQRIDDDAAVRALLRKALRDEWLYEPAVALYPGRRWSAFD